MQVIVDGLELPARWHPPAQSAYKVSIPALSQLQQKIRELARNVVVAEAAAKAKAAMQIKELQETVQNLESEVSNLGRHLDEQEERFDKQRENLTVRFAYWLQSISGCGVFMIQCLWSRPSQHC